MTDDQEALVRVTETAAHAELPGFRHSGTDGRIPAIDTAVRARWVVVRQ
jgi:hypothetical protein